MLFQSIKRQLCDVQVIAVKVWNITGYKEPNSCLLPVKPDHQASRQIKGSLHHDWWVSSRPTIPSTSRPPPVIYSVLWTLWTMNNTEPEAFWLHLLKDSLKIFIMGFQPHLSSEEVKQNKNPNVRIWSRQRAECLSTNVSNKATKSCFTSVRGKLFA